MCHSYTHAHALAHNGVWVSPILGHASQRVHETCNYEINDFQVAQSNAAVDDATSHTEQQQETRDKGGGDGESRRKGGG